MEKNKLRQVIIDQQSLFNKKEDLIYRDIDLEYYLKGNEIIVISGIRRCGKSSLLKLISEKVEGTKVFINFDDIRLVDFNLDNFPGIQDIVLELFGENEKITYFLDEVQNMIYWEKWVSNLYSQGIKVCVTGSNSNLLSSEISTYLTGRNKVIKLFPFSFREYLRLKEIEYLKPEHLTSSQRTKIYMSFSSYPFTCIVDVPTPVLFTSILTGMRQVSWSIWLITPMVLPDNRRLSSAFKAESRVSTGRCSPALHRSLTIISFRSTALNTYL